MRMFIANGMHQNLDFQYRLPESKRPRQQIIPIGSQVMLSGELSQKDIDAIIEQHGIYGMIEASEISRSNEHVAYVYSVGKPVSAEYIAQLVQHNRVIHTELGRRYRQEAAVATSSMIQDNTTDHLNSLEFTIREDTKNKDHEIDETVRVTSDEKRGASQNPNRPIETRRDLF